MADAAVQAINYIVKTPGFRNGEPHIADRHISVEFIASLYINGATAEEIAHNQELTPAQVHAALAYYYDHPSEIEAIWDEHRRIAAKHGISDEAQDTKREAMLAQLKERDPERYESIMRARHQEK